MNDIHIFEVGGAVRDALMGIKSKDVDFTVIAPSFDAMHQHLRDSGFKVHVVKPEFVTIRAGVPKDHPLHKRTRDADFVLARKDSATSDGRRPDFVEPGTLEDDLARRDFTVNAIALDPISGAVIDLFDGRADIASRTLRFVGDPMTRIHEDGLRVLRGFRFMITRSLHPSEDTERALHSTHAALMLRAVSQERIRDELNKMLSHDCIATVRLLQTMGQHTLKAIFRDRVRLCATMALA